MGGFFLLFFYKFEISLHNYHRKITNFLKWILASLINAFVNLQWNQTTEIKSCSHASKCEELKDGKCHSCTCNI